MGGKKPKLHELRETPRIRVEVHARRPPQTGEHKRAAGVDSAGQARAVAPARISSIPPPGADNSGVRPLPAGALVGPASVPPVLPLEHAVQSILPSPPGMPSAPPVARRAREPRSAGVIMDAREPAVRRELEARQRPGSPLKTALVRAAEGPDAMPRPERYAPRPDRPTPRAFHVGDAPDAPATPIQPPLRPSSAQPAPGGQSPMATAEPEQSWRDAYRVAAQSLPPQRAPREFTGTPRSYPPLDSEPWIEQAQSGTRRPADDADELPLRAPVRPTPTPPRIEYPAPRAAAGAGSWLHGETVVMARPPSSPPADGRMWDLRLAVAVAVLIAAAVAVGVSLMPDDAADRALDGSAQQAAPPR